MKFKMNNHEWEIKEISNAEMNLMEDSDGKETFTYGTTDYQDLVIYLNKDAKGLRTTLIHELTHVFLYEFGHNQREEKTYSFDDVCEVNACSHDIIHKIIEDYFKGVR